ADSRYSRGPVATARVSAAGHPDRIRHGCRLPAGPLRLSASERRTSCDRTGSFHPHRPSDLRRSPGAEDLARRRAGRRRRNCRRHLISSAYSNNMIVIRDASLSDADAIARIYNQGIEDRATLETEPRSAEERRGWL